MRNNVKIPGSGLRLPRHRRGRALTSLCFSVFLVFCVRHVAAESNRSAEPASSPDTSTTSSSPTRDPEPVLPSEATGGPGTPENRLPDHEDPAVFEDSCQDLLFNADGYAGTPEQDPESASFAVKVLDEVIPVPLMAVFVLPGQTITVEAVLTDPNSRFTAECETGELTRVEGDRWEWTAPRETGPVHIAVCDVTNRETIHLKAFVMVPYVGQTNLNGFEIGTYSSWEDGDAAYRMPTGMVEVTPGLEEEWLTPHFQLKQFLCKQKSEFPKYLVLRTRLLLKLEMLLQQLDLFGYDIRSLYVMSGFRTPSYNASIGNMSRFSRHSYGDAADVLVDQDRDGHMDDLNGDGTVTSADAYVLKGIVESLYGRDWYMPFVGGLAAYPENDHRSSFIHVDTRGRRARW